MSLPHKLNPTLRGAFIVAVVVIVCFYSEVANCKSSERPEAEVPAMKRHVDEPERVVEMVERSIKNSSLTRQWQRQRQLTFLSCVTGNPIDDCWRCDPDWINNRKRLADCAIGFGKNAIGGQKGRFYVVSDPTDDDPTNPRPGTLRHAVIKREPLWIVFQRDMVIQLKKELMVKSYKTVDGRGANIHIANGACIAVHHVTNVIIHGIYIHGCKPIRSDGDGISILGSTDVWVDHCSLSNCTDGLIDVTRASTAITLSNNLMTHHDKVMLLGHSDNFTADVNMQITVAFNRFGEGLVQRMPRCRHGFFHVVNNDYTHWEMYAIGGSANPTINSQGNRFFAPNDEVHKEVTKREHTAESVWRNWNWRSDGDLLLNGAFFTPSGPGAPSTYAKASSLGPRPAFLVGSVTADAGVLICRKFLP